MEQREPVSWMEVHAEVRVALGVGMPGGGWPEVRVRCWTDRSGNVVVLCHWAQGGQLWRSSATFAVDLDRSGVRYLAAELVKRTRLLMGMDEVQSLRDRYGAAKARPSNLYPWSDLVRGRRPLFRVGLRVQIRVSEACELEDVVVLDSGQRARVVALEAPPPPQYVHGGSLRLTPRDVPRPWTATVEVLTP